LLCAVFSLGHDSAVLCREGRGGRMYKG
jgi:hypothetical protein